MQRSEERVFLLYFCPFRSLNVVVHEGARNLGLELNASFPFTDQMVFLKGGGNA